MILQIVEISEDLILRELLFIWFIYAGPNSQHIHAHCPEQVMLTSVQLHHTAFCSQSLYLRPHFPGPVIVIPAPSAWSNPPLPLQLMLRTNSSLNLLILFQPHSSSPSLTLQHQHYYSSSGSHLYLFCIYEN